MKTQSRTITPYSKLAEIYDTVMADVDYETWTDYIDEIILTHNPEAEDVLELACGTGTMALSLEELDCYNITATDASADMIRKAREKADRVQSQVEFMTMNFLDLTFTRPFDVIFMVFDSLNYLHNESEILDLHRQVRKILKPDGIFVYDFTTPRNSRKAIRFLNNESKQVGERFKYHRSSSYDPKEQIHTNSFLIEEFNPHTRTVVEQFEELHRQKIYTYNQMEMILKKSDFTILEAYDGFELKPAHSKSLRITMVLQ